MSLDLFERETEERLSQMPRVTHPEAGAWDGFLRGTGLTAMEWAAKGARSVSMGLAAAPVLYDTITRGTEAQDRYFKSHDEFFQRAVEHWTPNPGEVGEAGRVAGTLLGLLPMVIASGGGSVIVTQLSVAEDLVRQGVDPAKANAVGTVYGAGLGAGILVPILGRTLSQRMLLGGAGFNVSQGVGMRLAADTILKGTPAEGQFQAFAPLDLTLDAILGLAFGGMAHLSPAMRAQGEAFWQRIEAWRRNLKPEEIEALGALRQAQHASVDSFPGKPTTPESLDAHVERVRRAVGNLAQDEPVHVTDLPAPAATPDQARIDEAGARAAELQREAERVRTEEGLPPPPEVSRGTGQFADVYRATPDEQPRAIGQAVEQALRSIGVEEPQAKANASIWEAFFRTAADRYSVPAARILEQYNPQIRRLGEQEDLEGALAQQRRAQVETPAFRSWFGASKVVDEKGAPLVVYHGTGDSITAFDLDHPHRKDTGWLGTGVYVTDSPPMAGSYSLIKGGSADPNVMPLYARLENPYYATKDEKQRIQLISHRQGAAAGRAAADQLTAELKAKGHDGVILDYKAEDVGAANASREMVVFDPAGVKSAVGNRGTFDPKDPNILFQSLPGQPRFYSELQRQLEAVKQESATPEQWKGMIFKPASKGKKALRGPDNRPTGEVREYDIPASSPLKGVTTEEIEWSGILEWLTLRTTQVEIDKALREVYTGAEVIEVPHRQGGGFIIARNGEQVNPQVFDNREQPQKLIDDVKRLTAAGASTTAKTTITKQEVLDFLKQGGVRVDEILYGPPPSGRSTLPALTDPAIAREVAALQEAGWRVEQDPEGTGRIAFVDPESGDFADARTMRGWLDAADGEITGSTAPTGDLVQAAERIERHMAAPIDTDFQPRTPADGQIQETVTQLENEGFQVVHHGEHWYVNTPDGARLGIIADLDTAAGRDLPHLMQDRVARVLQYLNQPPVRAQVDLEAMTDRLSNLGWEPVRVGNRVEFRDLNNPDGETLPVDEMAHMTGEPLRPEVYELAQDIADVMVGRDPMGRQYPAGAEPERATRWNRPDLVLPGGQNYRELELTLPRAGEQLPAGYRVEKMAGDSTQLDALTREWQAWLRAKNLPQVSADEMGARQFNVLPKKDQDFVRTFLDRWDTAQDLARTDRWTLVGPDGVGTVLNQSRSRVDAEDNAVKHLQRQGVMKKQRDFTEGHGDTPNVLAWVRFNERTDTDGKRVLFLEEVQSDWAQKGRARGFEGEKTASQFTIEQERNDNNPEVWLVRNTEGRVVNFGRTRAEAQRWADAHEEQSTSRERLPRAPFVQDTDSWARLTMKRMIAWAIENGFDRVAWTRGEQQVERYTSALRSRVDSIEWKKTEKGVHLVGYKGKAPQTGRWVFNDGEGYVAEYPTLEALVDFESEEVVRANPHFVTTRGIPEDIRNQEAHVERLRARRDELSELAAEQAGGYQALLGGAPRTIVKSDATIRELSNTIGDAGMLEDGEAALVYPTGAYIMRRANGSYEVDYGGSGATFGANEFAKAERGLWDNWSRLEAPDEMDNPPPALREMITVQKALYEARAEGRRMRERTKAREKVVDTTEREDELSDAVGKAMAKQILDDPAQTGTIEGENITIDKTGMAGFYDRILPAAAEQVAKKLGGGKVGETTIDVPGKSDANAAIAIDDPRPNFRAMDEQDMMGLAGAEDFADGTPPRLAESSVKLNGERIEATITVDGQGVHVMGPEGEFEFFRAFHGRIGESAETAMKAVRDSWSTPSFWSDFELISGKLPGKAPSGSKQMAIDITPKMIETAKKGLPLFQQGRGQIQFGDQETVIGLFENADASTFAHETGHFFLQVTRDLASRPTAPEQAVRDWGTLATWLKIEGGEITREQHEQFARGFETYLAEGKAPTQGLARVFEQFKQWLLAIYHSLTELDVHLSDDVRAVFDRMLGAPSPEGPAGQVAGRVAPPPRQGAQPAGLEGPRREDQPSRLLRDIRDLGGIEKGQLEEVTGEKRFGKMKGLPWGVFRAQRKNAVGNITEGHGLDQMARELRDRGWNIPEGDEVGALTRLLDEEIKGERAMRMGEEDEVMTSAVLMQNMDDIHAQFADAETQAAEQFNFNDLDPRFKAEIARIRQERDRAMADAQAEAEYALQGEAARVAREKPNLRIQTGQDADGNPVTIPVREFLENASRATARAAEDAKLFDAAAACLTGAT